MNIVQELRGALSIEYNCYPHLNAFECNEQLLSQVETPYVVFLSDDDFLIPKSLGKCVQFLEAHPDYGAAHGMAAIFRLAAEGAYGEIAWLTRYGQRAVEHASARQRLIDYLGSYYVTLFSVHHTQEFQREMDAAGPAMRDKAFRGELLPGCLSIIRGKSKELDCLSLIRQAHDQRYLLPDLYDWITSPDWLPSYQIFCDCLVGELARQDGISIAEAQEVVKQAFWSYLGQGLARKWQARYAQNGRGLPSRWRELAKRVPGLRNAWHMIFSSLPRRDDEMSLERLLNPSSPYYGDFLPIYRAITTSPRD